VQESETIQPSKIPRIEEDASGSGYQHPKDANISTSLKQDEVDDEAKPAEDTGKKDEVTVKKDQHHWSSNLPGAALSARITAPRLQDGDTQPQAAQYVAPTRPDCIGQAKRMSSEAQQRSAPVGSQIGKRGSGAFQPTK